MKKTFHHLIPAYLQGLLICVLLFVLQSRIWGQCSPDTTSPIITCPPNQALLVSAGQCSTPVTLADAVTSDDCSSVISVTSSMSSGDEFQTGTTSVLYTATDLAGNTATCQMTVKVSGSNPRPVCDRWVTIPMDPSGTTTVYPEDILLYGPYNCTQTGLSLAYDTTTPVPSLSFTGTGTHEIYGASIPENGFWEKCWSFVSIVGAGTESCTPDVTPPLVLCRPYYIVYSSTPDCQTVIELDEPYVSDNCGPVSLSSDAPLDNLFTQGDRTITYTATDNAGNTGTCTSTVRFSYAEIMLPVCHALTVTLDEAGTATVYPDDVLAGGPYDCVNRTISLEIDPQAPQLPFLTFTQPGVYYAQVYTINFNNIFHGCQSVITVNAINDECHPEFVPPTPNCDPFVLVETNTQGPNIARLYAEVLDNGSTDNCTAPDDLIFRVTSEDGTTPPATSYIDIEGIVSAQEAFLWIGDQAGNWNHCIVLVSTTPAQCTPDVMKPLVTPPPDLTLTGYALGELDIDFGNLPAEFPEIYAAFGVATHWDNCDNGNSLFSESFVLQSDQIIRRFFAQDFTGNLNEDMAQIITVVDGFSGHVPAWSSPGEFPDSLTAHGNNVFVAYSDQVFGSPCQAEPVKILRTWSLADFDYTPPLGIPGTLPLLDTDNDGIVGDAYDFIAIGDSIWLYENYVPIRPLIARTWSYEYLQVIQNTFDISGIVFIDTLPNCAFDDGEALLNNWKVKAVGQPSNVAYTTFTDDEGAYTLQVCPGDTSVEISLDVPFNYAGACPPVYVLDVTGTGPWTQDIPVQLNADCALLNVDLAPSYLRPCFAGFYAVNYYNYSQQTVGNSYVDVALDPFVQFQTATVPGTLQSGNTYRFATGNLLPGASGQFRIFYVLDCNAPMGMTHCTEASIFPDTVCGQDQAWSGAELRVTGFCDGDSVRLKITNVGTNPMIGQLDYVVTEDLIMARKDDYQLNPEAFVDAVFHADGATWRMETPQEPGHPWGGIISATVEGCGGLNTAGLVNVFTVDDNDPFSATDCTQNIGSFDPNDKRGFPQGYGDQHLIERNIDLEYRIRFQNTGTDTAFTVVILDTLSQHLDAESIRPGASSHDFDFDLLEGNIIRFRFDNILLPDSNVNEVASHGFVQFRIAQQPDNPLGTVIHNSAAIYFDFNDPVITNETWHTVDENFVEVVSINDPGGIGPLRVYPNPASETVFFELPSTSLRRRFELTDGTGRTVRSGDFPEKVFRLDRSGLPAGMYFFRILAVDGAVISGKVVMK